MRTTSLFSLFGIAFMVGTALVACGGGDDDDAAPAVKLSGKGQSCARTADCASKLVCIDQRCVESGSASGGNAGSDGSGGTTGGTNTTGGTGGSNGGKGGSAGTGGGAPAPVLGSEGESCTRRADCEAALSCFNQRCSMDNSMTGGGGEAGTGGTVTPPPGPALGQNGETCVLPSDCAAGLTCVPGGIAAGNLGICAVTSSGLDPTGMTCTAECETADDCCELPLEIQTTFVVKSCADLEEALSGVDCTDPGSFAPQCFAQATYCECNSATWRCTVGACVYNAPCADDGLTTEGCATYSRSGRPLVSTCNEDSRCQGTAADPICSSDDECETLVVADDNTDTCSRATGNCYRKCADDLDCAKGFVCNTGTHVCVAAPECGEDFDCVRKHGDVNWSCNDNGACVNTCDNDLDCNAGGLVNGYFQNVCNANHVCEALGCRTSDDCISGAVRMFCVEPPAPGAGVAAPNSAITDGK